MEKYSYKFMTIKGWQKRGIRVEAKNTKEAFEKAKEIYLERHPEEKGHPLMAKWSYAK